jgi:hypothetical protein
MMQSAVQHFHNLRAEGMPYMDALRSTAFRFGVLWFDLEKAVSA